MEPATTPKGPTQHCNMCDKDKPVNEFYKSSKTRCKTCWQEHFDKIKAKKLEGTTEKKDDVKAD